jgi:hypothetical protein
MGGVLSVSGNFWQRFTLWHGGTTRIVNQSWDLPVKIRTSCGIGPTGM